MERDQYALSIVIAQFVYGKIQYVLLFRIAWEKVMGEAELNVSIGTFTLNKIVVLSNVEIWHFLVSSHDIL